MVKHLSGRVEHYVLDLCDEALGEPGSRQHTFEWLRGDRSPGREQGRKLQLDSFWPSLRLAVEVHERQHDVSSPFFDRRGTVSGVGRGEQRRIYDERRAALLPEHGLRLVVIRPSDLSIGPRGTRKPDREADLATVTSLLS